MKIKYYSFLSHYVGRSKHHVMVYLRYTPGITNRHSNHWDITKPDAKNDFSLFLAW